MFSALRIRTKILIIVALAMVGMASISATGLYILGGQMLSDRQAKLTAVVESARTIVEGAARAAERGEITVQAAKERAIAVLSTLRFETDNYVFVLDTQGTMLMHPVATALVGKDARDIKDPHGVYFVREALPGVQRQGYAMVEYHWAKPGVTEPVLKLSRFEAYAPWGWVVSAGIYMDDVEAAFRVAALEMAGIAAVLLLISAGIALLVSRAIVKPIPTIQNLIGAARQGDLSQNVAVESRDEIGQMTEDFNQLVGGLRSSIAEVGEASASVSAASTQLDAASLEMSRGAESLSGRATEITNAVTEVVAAVNDLSSIAEELSASAESVASAAEELTASINEVAHHASQSSDVAHKAAGAATQARETLSGAESAIHEAVENIQQLAQASTEIGKVIGVISDIASQTNLLALNATIEAARAGEAGKGFAVVAHEVKNLANQSAKATEEISHRILATQEQTGKSVASIETVAEAMLRVASSIAAINDVIGSIDQIASSIASEVSQQSATTSEIGRNVSQVAMAAKSVAADTTQTAAQAHLVQESVQTMSQVAHSTAAAATETQSAAAELGRQAVKLDGMVARFKLTA